MERDAIPPLLRGVGTTIILIAAVFTFFVARRDVERHRTMRETNEARRQPSSDVKSLASDIQELRGEVEHENIIEEVLENRWFEWMGFIGSGFIAGSFFAEFYIRRSKPA